MDYTTKGQGNLNTVLGAVGTGLGIMNGGLNLTGGTANCQSSDHNVTRYEMDMQMGYEKQLQSQALQIANLEAEKISDKKDVELYKQIKDEMNRIEARIGTCESAVNQQAVWNATQSGIISCLQGQVAQLQAMTKTVIPLTNICPQPAVATTPAP